MEREGGRAAVVEIDPCFVFHLANATEQRCRGDTCFTVDCIRYTEMPNFDDLMGYGAGFEFVRPECQPKSELWRLEVRIPCACMCFSRSKRGRAKDGNGESSSPTDGACRSWVGEG